MKRHQKFITTLSLIVALTGMSPVVMADAGSTSGGGRIQPDTRQFESSLEYKLSTEQMDNIRGGMIDDGHNPTPGFDPTDPSQTHGGVNCRFISCAGL
jgi:hypothetical protein